MMENISHFSHKEHPLKLIQNIKRILDGDHGDNDEKKGVACFWCKKPISGGSVYACITCHYYLHKTCSQIAPIINHHFHPQHPLVHVDYDSSVTWFCDACGHKGQELESFYECASCNFVTCTKCVVVAATRKAFADVLKEDVSVKFEHEGHPQHTFKLQSRLASFCCDAYNSNDEDLFYQCNSCDFWIHKTCASLALTIDLPHHHKHPLILLYSLPEKFHNFNYFCEFCKDMIFRNYWVYHCANCRYFAHIKCALNANHQPSTPRDGAGTSNDEEQTNDHDILHFPMSYAFRDPLKQLYVKKTILDDMDIAEINHSGHNHPLILNMEPQGNNMPNIVSHDPIVVCYACVRPLSLPYYSCKDECSFFLHKYCAELPSTLEHQLHRDHSLTLVDFDEESKYRCNGCSYFGNTFAYTCKTCKFCLDVNCAFLPNTIKHESHKHPLVQVIDLKLQCSACKLWSNGIGYVCKACDFYLDMYCAMRSPHAIAHRYCKRHQVLLTYPPVEDHPHDFYCDICEEEMHPKWWLYHCHNCDNSFHIACIARDDAYENVKLDGTIYVHYHKHPLTYVRRKKTPKYVCSYCNVDINGYLVLECRARVCDFKVCTNCHRKRSSGYD